MILRSSPNYICRQCGALNDFGSSECWLCQSPNWRGILAREHGHNDAPAPRGLFGSTMVSIVLIAMAAVIAGIGEARRGLAIALVFCVLTAWASRKSRRPAAVVETSR